MAIGSNSVAGKITVTGEVVTKGFSDFKAKIDSAVGVVTKLSSAIDSVLDRNGKFTAMLAANTMSIDAARAATGGLIDDFSLLAAANRATALGIKMSAGEFAELSRAATVMSRKLGTDASEAVNDLITGIGRQSMAILDNLGIIVRAEEAYENYAAANGKAANELTDVEKRTAFQEEAIRKLTAAAGENAIKANDAASAWLRFKNTVKNFWDRTVGEALGGAAKWIEDMTDPVEGLRKKLHESRIALGEWQRVLDDGGIMRGAAASEIQRLNKEIAEYEKRLVAATKAQLRVSEADPFAAHKFGSSGLMAPSVAEPLTIGGIPTALRGGKGKRESRGGGEIDVERFRPAFGEGLELGGLDQRAENIKAIDMTIAADNRWIDSELAKQEALQVTVLRLREVRQEVEFAANSNAQYMRTWAEGFADVSAGVGEFTAGLWSAADAAIVSGESFGAAVLKQVKAELMGVAARSTIAALYFTGMGFASLAGFNPVSASQWFTAAGIMAAVAAAAGAGALGISSATSKSSGRDAGDRHRIVGAGTTTNADQKREKEKEINVYVYLGDKYDRSAQLYMRRTAEAAA